MKQAETAGVSINHSARHRVDGTRGVFIPEIHPQAEVTIPLYWGISSRWRGEGLDGGLPKGGVSQ